MTSKKKPTPLELGRKAFISGKGLKDNPFYWTDNNSVHFDYDEKEKRLDWLEGYYEEALKLEEIEMELTMRRKYYNMGDFGDIRRIKDISK